MKHLRQICLGFFLILALSITAFAGEISTPGFTDGPQESPGVTGPQESPGVTGDITCPGFTGEILFASVAGIIQTGLAPL